MNPTIKRARELLARITPGPWEWGYAHPGWLLGGRPEYRSDPPGYDIPCVLDGIQSEDRNDCNVLASDDDRAFIAAAPDLVARLCDALEKAEAVCHVMEHAVELGYFADGGSTNGWAMEALAAWRPSRADAGDRNGK